MIPPEPIRGAAAEAETPKGLHLPAAGAEGEQVEQYVHDQLDMIRQARADLAAEKQQAEHALDQRRQELELQSQVVVSRLQELNEREQRLADDLEYALPERISGFPRRSHGRDDAEAEPDLDALQRQLREQQMSLELLSAERDAAWAQLQQYRDQQELIDQLQAERDAQGGVASDQSYASDGAHGEVEGLRQQFEALQQEMAQVLRERDDALAYVNELPERLKQIEELKTERDAVLEQLRGLSKDVEKVASQDSGWVDLDSPPGEMEMMKLQLREQQEQIEQLRRERDDAWNYLQELPDQHQKQIEQIQVERDAALFQLRQLSQEPEFYAQQEAEFAALRIQVKQEQRQLAEEAKELHRRESEIHEQSERTQQELAQEQQRLEQLSAQLNELNRQMRDDRSHLEIKERELRLRDAQLHLREAEIREMIEIAELDTARERSELNQERLKLARLREAIRLERAALKTDMDAHGRKMPPLGSES